MEAITLTALAFYPPAPSNGGALDAQTPRKIGDWTWQPKVDDWRGAADAETLEVWNQYGEPSTVALQGKLAESLRELQCRRRFFRYFDIGIMENRHDMMRGAIIVFDVMGTPWNHRERRQRLEEMFPILPMASELLANGNTHGGVYLINEFREDAAVSWNPLAMQAWLQGENERIGRKFYEGLVAKRRDALYPICTKPKQKTAVWVKHRFDQ